MAKIRLVMAMTLDGYLPDENELLMRWVKANKHGFPYWRERSTFDLPANYPMLDLIAKKRNKEKSFIFSAEIADEQKVDLLQALLTYKIIDEWVIYILPYTQGNGISLTSRFMASFWLLNTVRKYKNGICRMIYSR